MSVDLPDPVGPTSATVWPGVDAHGDPVEHGALPVREGQVPELDLAADIGQRHQPVARRILDLRRVLQHLEHALPRREAALHHVRHPAERDHRPRQHRQVGVERDEPADRDPAADHLAAPQPQHQQRAQAEEERHARVEHPLQADEPPVALEVFAVRAGEARHLGRFLAVGPHDPDAGQRLLRDRAQVRELSLDALEPLVNGRRRSSGRRSTRTAAGSARPASASQSIDSISAMATTNRMAVFAEYMIAGPTVIRTALRSLVARDIRSPVRCAWKYRSG